MTGVLVGDPECEFMEIVHIFDNPSISTLKLEWPLMAMGLNINPVDIKIMKNRNQSLEETIYDILVLWRSNNAETSTLGNFLKKIPRDWNQLKEYVRDIIWEKAKTWNELDEVLQERVLKSKVRFLGLVHTLSSLEVHLEENTLKKHLPQKPFLDVLKCDKFEFPIPLPYYINRTLTIRQKLNPEIFQENCEDIFVFEGIERYQLSMLKKAKQTSTQQESTDDTCAQLKLLKFSVRFMCLKYQNDFSKIVRKTSHPVHRIKFNKMNNTYNWICTFGSIHLITKFLSDSYEEITEDNFIINTLSVFNSRPVAICSSAGMGKSFLLKNLASRMKCSFPERFVIILPMQKVIERLNKTQGQINIDLVIDTLANESTSHGLGNIILSQKMKNENSQFEIFLDGFDEIPSGSLYLAKQFLKVLLNSTNMRCHITSRPHMSIELERTVGVVSYNIAPFTSKDQNKFFCDYWRGELNINNDNLLSKFASLLLESPNLLKCTENMYGEIAGIPLQCFMLAQLYSEKLKNYCEDQSSECELMNCPLTLLELYEQFIEYKFRRFSDRDEKEIVKKFHWLNALDVLFPDSPEALIIRHSLESQLAKTDLANEILFGVGILETRNEFDSPAFVHRTFAEYLLAEYIVEEFLKKRTDLNATWSTFVYETTLEIQEITPDHTHSELHQKFVNIIKFSSFWKNKEISETDFKILEMVQRSHQLPMLTYLHEENLLDDDDHEKRRLWSRFIVNQRSFKRPLNDMVEKFDDLVYALYRLEWFEIADELERAAAYRLPKFKFLHSTVSVFLDAILMKCQNVMLTHKELKFPVHRGLFSQLNKCSKTFLIKLLTCTETCFENLTRLILMFGCETTSLNWQIDYIGCQEILLFASNQSNVEFFKYCCMAVRKFASVGYGDAKFSRKIKTPDFNMEYVHTPLHVAVSKGNYNLTEYLVDSKQADRLAIHGLWQLCLHDSYKDHEHVIEKKEQTLSFLKLNELIFNFDEIISDEFPFKVHSKLFTKFCDVVEYVPCEKDIETIGSHVIKYCDNNGSQMDKFVNWVQSKNLMKILTHRFNNTSSLLNIALRYNKVSPETFCKIFKLVPFDPSYGILWNAVLGNRCEEMVKAIVELTGEVDLVDKTERNRTLLHFSVFKENLNAVKFLLLKGAKVSSKDIGGNTPLHLALVELYPVQDIVKLLLEYSSEEDVKTKNRKGKTPLSLFMKDRGLWKWEKSIVELFKEKYFTKDTQLEK